MQRKLPLALSLLLVTVAVPMACDSNQPDAAAAPVAAATPAASRTSAPEQSSPGEAMTEQVSDPANDQTSTPQGRNHLGDETSPYLLQHQHNPVHWYPWGEEAFEAARRLDRPIFMSVGYSTCYWCHVMERESFEDDGVAEILNKYFIAIKVDREERPDVDDIYMTAVNVLNRGNGGWPMSVWMEPNGLKPFLAGTYFPKEDGGGRPGFKSVLLQIVDYWQNRREPILQQADQVATHVAQTMSQLQTPVPVGPDDVGRGVAQLMSSYDETHGGFGRQRKFPMASNFEFLIGAAWDDPIVRERLIYTLDRMAIGGLYDQIGGGFHRYTVDEKWLVPHFEKMLYDNGQLASIYAEAYARTGDAFYAEILRETLDYIGRQMTSDQGAFFSAQDAEVNHREGENYIWTADQIREALTEANLANDVAFTLAAYGFDAGTNFRDPHHPGDGEKNVVYLVDRPARQAEAMGLSRLEFDTRLARVNEALLAVRDQRDQPITDDKIIVGWNGLMIAGLADGGRVLGEPKYVEAARRAASFILDEMDPPGTPPDGGLRRTYRAGQAKISAFLEDYAYFIRGLLALHRASGDDGDLQVAIELANEAKTYFWDESRGAYFDTRAGQSDLFVRVKSTYDGAVPSGNGVMLNNLLELHEVTSDPAYLDDALAALGALAGVVNRSPSGSVSSLLALDRIAKRYPDRLAPSEDPAARLAGVTRGPVRIGVSVSELKLAAGASASFEITVELQAGHHLNSNEPGIDYLIPLTVTVAGGSGVAIEATYPAGEPFDGPEGAMLVHHGKVTIPVKVTRTGDIAGTPAIMLGYQVCNESVCLAPQNEPLAVRVVAE